MVTSGFKHRLVTSEFVLLTTCNAASILVALTMSVIPLTCVIFIKGRRKKTDVPFFAWGHSFLFLLPPTYTLLLLLLCRRQIIHSSFCFATHAHLPTSPYLTRNCLSHSIPGSLWFLNFLTLTMQLWTTLVCHQPLKTFLPELDTMWMIRVDSDKPRYFL